MNQEDDQLYGNNIDSMRKYTQYSQGSSWQSHLKWPSMRLGQKNTNKPIVVHPEVIIRGANSSLVPNFSNSESEEDDSSSPPHLPEPTYTCLARSRSGSYFPSFTVLPEAYVSALA
mmetsp:Transcript_24971/g.37358  ORF Transcript_24971/g.37358 Transcript_24971/m.37358 type:complete len:116 (-) Transcript_24971:1772-2119(-)